MKYCRAVVIDGRKVIKNGAAVLCCAAVLALAAIGTVLSGRDIFPDVSVVAEKILSDCVPTVAAQSKTNLGDEGGSVVNAVKKTLCFMLTLDLSDFRTVLNGEIPCVKVIHSSALAKLAFGTDVVYNPQNVDRGEDFAEPETAQDGKYLIKAVDSSQKKALGEGKILIRNETGYSVNTEEMLAAPLKFDMAGEGPKILILHTHATESYSAEGAEAYSPQKGDRSLNTDESVVRVGSAMKAVFEKNGISVIHDTTLHDHPNFNGSYANSLKTVEAYKTKYPSIRIVLDIHRDAFVYDDGSKAKFVTRENGKDAAQLMLVVGTDAGGLEHPEWRENMKLALKFQSCISAKYPSLMRGVNLRKERFNGHTTAGSMIIEVGSSGNSLSEALNGAELGAEAVSEFLNTLK